MLNPARTCSIRRFCWNLPFADDRLFILRSAANPWKRSILIWSPARVHVVKKRWTLDGVIAHPFGVFSDSLALFDKGSLAASSFTGV